MKHNKIWIKVFKLLSVQLFFMLTTTFLSANISGTIFRDFNLNAMQYAKEAGVSGLTIKCL